MGSERRGRAVHGRLEVNPSGEEPTDRPKQKLKAFEIRKRLVFEAWENGAFYRSELYSIAARIDEHLVRWAMQKFKRLRGQPTKAWRWLDAARQREPQLFAHWHLLASTPRRTVGAV